MRQKIDQQWVFDTPSRTSALSETLRRDRDSIRLNEWETDVPMIGVVYQDICKSFVYLNGIGRPFVDHGWSMSTHWLNRVWTLQESYKELRLITFLGTEETTTDPWQSQV